MKKANFFVFDTNVLIGAMLMPDSKCGIALSKGINSGKIIISEETFVEATESILREKFEKYVPLPQRKEYLLKYREVSILLIVDEIITLCRDPKDDKFLSLAKAGNASAIITGDKDLLILNPFENMCIVTPDEFLKLF